MLGIETLLRQSGINLIAGVDEAGRGACAGPLVVAAVILQYPSSPTLARVSDSKTLSEKVREELFNLIAREALAYSIIEITSREIDTLGLHKTNLEGMRRAINSLDVTPEYVLTDGYPIQGLAAPSLAIWKGDRVAVSVSAASILAKVYRDRIMVKMDATSPGYGFALHKGYITAFHSRALADLGPSEAHRKSFSNIASLINTQ